MKTGDRVRLTAVHRRRICVSNTVYPSQWKITTCQSRGGTVVNDRGEHGHVLISWDGSDVGALWFHTIFLMLIEEAS